MLYDGRNKITKRPDVVHRTNIYTKHSEGGTELFSHNFFHCGAKKCVCRCDKLELHVDNPVKFHLLHVQNLDA